MDLQAWVNLVVAVGAPLVGWMVKRQADRDKEFQVFQLEVARDYVRHTHLDEIKETLKEILRTLNQKEDKRAAYREGN